MSFTHCCLRLLSSLLSSSSSSHPHSSLAFLSHHPCQHSHLTSVVTQPPQCGRTKRTPALSPPLPQPPTAFPPPPSSTARPLPLPSSLRPNQSHLPLDHLPRSPPPLCPSPFPPVQPTLSAQRAIPTPLTISSPSPPLICLLRPRALQWRQTTLLRDLSPSPPRRQQALPSTTASIVHPVFNA
ncbi:hypothetical protein EDD21DRAFT_387025 [Dissophora ornata]|nr:hypothetical protein EDD21DRAFT_387025 [Dissophora ornata]